MNIDELKVTLKMLDIVNFEFADCLILIFNDDNFEQKNFIIDNLLKEYYHEQVPNNEYQIIVKIK